MRRPPKSLIHEWERKLTRYGLANAQVGPKQNLQRRAVVRPEREGIQSSQFDSGIDRRKWKARVKSYSFSDLSSIHRVRVAEYERDVPAWALDDAAVREFLRHLSRGKRKSRGPARLAYVLYHYYRLLSHVDEIAEKLRVKPEAVRRLTERLHRHADIFFGTDASKWKFCCRRYHKPGVRIFRPNQTVPPKKVDLARALEMREQGKSLREIGAVFGVSASGVHKAIQRNKPVTVVAHLEEVSR